MPSLTAQHREGSDFRKELQIASRWAQVFFLINVPFKWHTGNRKRRLRYARLLVRAWHGVAWLHQPMLKT